jgi:ATP-dependent DNA helicase RecQ
VYFRDEARIEWLRAIRNREQAQMAAYAKSHGCLMQFLTEALGAPEPLPCGKCANCSSTPLPTTYRPALALKADGFLRRNDQWIEPRTAWPVDALAAHGWHGIIRPELRAEHGRALSRWGDDGWGSVVRKGKQRASRPASTFDTILSTLKWLCTGRQPTMFDEPLIAAVVGLVCERWRPTPFPTWVTCVPSLKHPTLVPNLARRIAQELRLPLVPCVRKIRDTQPQKTMQNDYQQAHNLAGTFAVEAAAVRDGPVLLVDDMIDSGWTFTVITALLRSAGAGPVFPLALAVTSRTSDG